MARKRSYLSQVHVKKTHLAPSLFHSFLYMRSTPSSIEPLCYALQSDDIYLENFLTVSEIMAPQNVIGQSDFTITYVRFNGIFNTLYASGSMIDVSIDFAPKYFRGRRISSTRNIHGWSFDEEQNTLFVDNRASSCNIMVKPPTESDFMCQRGARILLQELDKLLTSHHHNVSSWETVATEAGKGVLDGLAILLRYAGNMPDRTAPQGGWDLATIENWITTDLMTDEHPVTGETTEARQAFWLVRPYCSTISSSHVDWKLFMDDSSDDNGEHDGSDTEGVEAGESDTMKDNDHNMDRLQETTEKLMLNDEAMDIC